MTESVCMQYNPWWGKKTGQANFPIIDAAVHGVVSGDMPVQK